MRQSGLDFARHPRRRWGRWLVFLLLVLAVLRAAPFVAAGVITLPNKLDAALAAHYAANLKALERENVTLRAALATRPIANVNAAVLLERRPGALVLVCQNAAVGTAVLDAAGRYVGCVVATGFDTATIALAGTAGCPVAGLVGGAAGQVARTATGVAITGLPVGKNLAAGQAVYTVAGYLLGELAQAPAPDAAGLSAAAPLEHCADAFAAEYYLAPQ